jgi:hypothetical protein
MILSSETKVRYEYNCNFFYNYSLSPSHCIVVLYICTYTFCKLRIIRTSTSHLCEYVRLGAKGCVAISKQ